MIVAIVQARMGSTRLPGKTLADIQGKPMLGHIVERLSKSELIEKIVVATTTKEADKPILRLAEEYGVHTFSGSEEDVLDRHYQAARQYNSDVIVRVSSDCALADPQVVDKVIGYYLEGDYDYVSNTLKRTYPDGLDVEVFSFPALKRAWQEARLSSEREHVTPYIWKNPDKFLLANVENEADFSFLRWCVDTEKDLIFVREVYKRLYKPGQIFFMEDILSLLQAQPDLLEINQGIPTNEGYLKSLREDRPVR